MAAKEEPLRTVDLVHNGAKTPLNNLSHDHEEANGVKDSSRRRDEEVHDAELVVRELSSGSSLDEPNGPDKGDDQGDALGFGKNSVSMSALPNRRGPAAVMPVEKDAERYNMNHRRRGLAFIFNHKTFDTRLGLKQRNGTDADRDNLRFTLQTLDFDVSFAISSYCQGGKRSGILVDQIYVMSSGNYVPLAKNSEPFFYVPSSNELQLLKLRQK